MVEGIAEYTEPREIEKGAVNNVTQEKVDEYFYLRDKLRLAKTLEEFLQQCSDFGVHLERADLTGKPSAQIKTALAKFAQDYFPQSHSVEEQREKLEQVIATTVNYLQSQRSQIVLWVGGSFGKGKISKATTDLDLYLGLPEVTDEFSRRREYEILLGLKNIGYVFCDLVAPTQNILPIFETGRGMAPIRAITNTGVQMDIHALGMKDLQSMHSIFPGYINRVSPLPEPGKQDSISFTGQKISGVERSKTIVENYTKKEGQILKGLYPDNVATVTELLYDPNNQGSEVQHNVWFSLVKAFIFHNDGYIQDELGKTARINRSKISFRAFLKTLWYQDAEDYGKEKLSLLEKKYNEIVEEVAARYSLKID